MIDRLVIFGGTGDLTGRYLLPGLAALRARGHLADGFTLVGASREDHTDEQYRNWATDWLQREAPDVDRATTETLVRSARYERLDLGDPASVAACLAGEGPVAVYLALPPAVFPIAVTALQHAELHGDSQVVLEKPFGEDLDSARALNRLLADLVDERHVFRVDHFLAMTTVQNVLGTRLANSRSRTPLEQHSHRGDRDHLGGVARTGGEGRLLRRRGRAQGHDAEPPAAVAVSGGDGAADHRRRARPCVTVRWTCFARSARCEKTTSSLAHDGPVTGPDA